MTFSVWDHASRRYDYYRTPEKSADTHAPKPAHLRSAKLGLTPEQAAWPLPSGAKLVGRGKYPKGRIANRESAGLGLGQVFGLDLTSPTTLLLTGALGYMVWKFLWLPAQRR